MNYKGDENRSEQPPEPTQATQQVQAQTQRGEVSQVSPEQPKAQLTTVELGNEPQRLSVPEQPEAQLTRATESYDSSQGDS